MKLPFSWLSFLSLWLLSISLGLSLKPVSVEANTLGRLLLQYQNSNSHQEIRGILIKSRVFDTIIEKINSSGLVIRENIPVIFKDCGTANAYWNADKKEITVCYENTALDLSLFHQQANYSPEEALIKSINETIFAFYHELGHALIDVLSLSAVGQEEDTVDEFATIMLFRSYSQDKAAEIVLDSSQFYEILYTAGGRGPGWDEHAPNDKRLFNLVCWVYGSNPQKYEQVFIKKFVLVDGDGKIDQDALERRAAQCRQEFPQKVASWNKLLLPHFVSENRNQPPSPNSNGSSGVSRRGSHW